MRRVKAHEVVQDCGAKIVIGCWQCAGFLPVRGRWFLDDDHAIYRIWACGSLDARRLEERVKMDSKARDRFMSGNGATLKA